MDKSLKAKLVQTIDAMGLALADEDHVWTDEERKLYEESIALLA